jgi:predicted esterase
MSPVALIALAVGGIALTSSKRKKPASKSKPRPKECEAITTSGGRLANVDYLEIVTAGADPNARLPMIVSLHGLGYDYEAHIKHLEQIKVPVRIILPNAFYEKSGPKKRAWWPSYSNKALQDASKWLAQFVYLIQQCRPTVGKPVMTGHSMGGYIAIDFATQFPELISFSVPFAGARSSALWDIEPRVPVYAVHGMLDNSYDKAAAYYHAMSKRGLPVYLTSVEGGAHRIASANAEAWRGVLTHLVT